MIDTEELVDFYLKSNRSYRQRDQGHTLTGWRASSLGNCPRRQTYSRLGVPAYREMDAKTLRTFSYGDMVHDWLKRFYRNSGILIAEEGKLADPERHVAGHFDVLLGTRVAPISETQRERWSPWWTEFVEGMRTTLGTFVDPTDEAVLGEIKSMSPYALKYARQDGAKDYHQVQLGAYLMMAKKDPSQLPVEVTGGRLIYVGKDSSAPILEFEADWSWAERASDIVDQLNACWDSETLPPCTCVDWQVGYCDYLHPSARTPMGAARKGIVGGTDCCSPDLWEPALQAKETAEAEKGKVSG